jgi:hypothetical protein
MGLITDVKALIAHPGGTSYAGRESLIKVFFYFIPCLSASELQSLFGEPEGTAFLLAVLHTACEMEVAFAGEEDEDAVFVFCQQLSSLLPADDDARQQVQEDGDTLLAPGDEPGEE